MRHRQSLLAERSVLAGSDTHSPCCAHLEFETPFDNSDPEFFQLSSRSPFFLGISPTLVAYKPQDFKSVYRFPLGRCNSHGPREQCEIFARTGGRPWVQNDGRLSEVGGNPKHCERLDGG